jgi:hypothetical protein
MLPSDRKFIVDAFQKPSNSDEVCQFFKLAGSLGGADNNRGAGAGIS